MLAKKTARTMFLANIQIIGLALTMLYLYLFIYFYIFYIYNYIYYIFPCRIKYIYCYICIYLYINCVCVCVYIYKILQGNIWLKKKKNFDFSVNLGNRTKPNYRNEFCPRHIIRCENFILLHTSTAAKYGNVY